jgi:hypothetical protein
MPVYPTTEKRRRPMNFDMLYIWLVALVFFLIGFAFGVWKTSRPTWEGKTADEVYGRACSHLMDGKL